MRCLHSESTTDSDGDDKHGDQFGGSDIACPTDDPTETIVNQWPLTKAEAPLTVDGATKASALPWSEQLRNPKWAQCDGIGCLFPEPGSVGKVSADRACIVLYEETGKGLILAVSDPTHERSTFRVTIGEPLAEAQLPAGVSSAVENAKTVVTYHAEKGRNYVVRFAR